MLERQHCTLFYLLAFAFIFGEISAISHRDDYGYDLNPPSPRQGLLHHDETEDAEINHRQPGELLGRLIGSFVVNAINRKYNYGDTPDTQGNEYIEPGLEDPYDHAPYDNYDPKTDDLDQYDPPNLPGNGDRYSTFNKEPGDTETFNKGASDTGKTINDEVSNNYPNSYDLPDINNRFQTNPEPSKNPNSIINGGFRSEYGPRVDENIPLDKNKLNNENVDRYNKGTFKVLTIQKFMVQAQPVRPKNEKIKEQITLYYID